MGETTSKKAKVTENDFVDASTIPEPLQITVPLVSVKGNVQVQSIAGVPLCAESQQHKCGLAKLFVLLRPARIVLGFYLTANRLRFLN